MDTKMFSIWLIELLIFIIVIAGAIIAIQQIEKELKSCTCPGDAGTQISYVVYHGNSNTQYVNVKTSERYDDKYFEYLEHIQEARDKTFMKGRVFLTEK